MKFASQISPLLNYYVLFVFQVLFNGSFINDVTQGEGLGEVRHIVTQGQKA